MRRRHGAPLIRTGFRKQTLCLLALVWLSTGGVSSAQSWLDLVDYTKLRSRVGPSLATGAGVAISQVEAGGTAYFVDTSLPVFNGSLDPIDTPAEILAGMGTPLTVIDGSNMSHTISAHAGGVGSRFYGDADSMAPGANTVTLYETNSWLTNVLQYAWSAPPVAQNFRVQNHSWVGTLATPPPEVHLWDANPNNVKVLQRYDYLIDTANNGDGMTAVVGLNNSGNPLPYLMCYSLNAIAVGMTAGGHSAGPTASPPADAYFPGRTKPEIVAPFTSTSFATAAVSSAATLLHESGAGTLAAKNETMKSVLLAGATKNEFPGWTNTETQPLNQTFGAGELNIYNSYLIQRGGQFAGSQTTPSPTVGAYGWDYQNFKGNTSVGDIFYNFVIPAGSTAQELSIILSWDAEVKNTSTTSGVFTPSTSLQDMNLQFYNSTSGSLGSPIKQSISSVDNVEHIYLTNLAAGTYTLKVTGAANWDYGLAWRTLTKFNSPSADFNSDGVVDGADFLAWQKNQNKLLGTTAAQGDADGDGDVDADDLAKWKLGVISATSQAASSLLATAVPEPATAALLTLGLAALAGLRRALRRQ